MKSFRRTILLFVSMLVGYSIGVPNAARIDYYCNTTKTGEDIGVNKNDAVYLTASGRSSCVVLFKSNDGFTNLHYQFESFSSKGFTTKMESRHTYTRTSIVEATYDEANPPSLHEPFSTDTQLQFNVTRDEPISVLDNISFVVKIYRKDMGYFEDLSNLIGLTFGAIVGIVIGVIGLIIIIIVVCCVVKSSKRRSNGGTVITTQPMAMQSPPYSGQQYGGQQYGGQQYGGQQYAGQPYGSNGQPYISYGMEGVGPTSAGQPASFEPTSSSFNKNE